MYNGANQYPIKAFHNIQDIEPLERFHPAIVTGPCPEDRALLERALAFLNGTGDGSWQERGAIADAIQARLARG